QLADELAAQIPRDTICKYIWLPMIRATLELRHHNREGALGLLQQSSPYESIGFFNTLWMTGQAFLQMKEAPEATAEFQKIIEHRGWNVLSPFWPLAHLGLGRAAMISGDTAKARQAYQAFFAIWKDADADLPVLIEAKKEYERLR